MQLAAEMLMVILTIPNTLRQWYTACIKHTAWCSRHAVILLYTNLCNEGSVEGPISVVSGQLRRHTKDKVQTVTTVQHAVCWLSFDAKPVSEGDSEQVQHPSRQQTCHIHGCVQYSIGKPSVTLHHTVWALGESTTMVWFVPDPK